MPRNAPPPPSSPTLEPHTVPAAKRHRPDDIVIPAIFLTEGKKNTRILRQNERIESGFRHELQQRDAHVRHMHALQQALLAELNDNGAGAVFTAGPDVDRLLKRVSAQDSRMVTERHFYYFDEAGAGEGAAAIADLAHLVQFPQALAKALQSRGMGICTFAEQALGWDSVPLLEKVARFVWSQPPQGASLDQLMARIGARDSTSVKLVHYNNNARLTIIRASIVFALCRGAASLCRQLVLCSLDFILNKRERLYLVEWVVNPVVDYLLPETEPIQRALDGLVLTHNGTPLLRKKLEAHYNFLCNAAHPGLDPLRYQFLYNHSAFSIERLLDAIESIGCASMDLDTVFHNHYRAHLAARIVTRHFYQAHKECAKLQVALHRAKDKLQSTLGHFANETSIRDKSELASVCSETYHVLNNAAAVLDKNVVFFQRSFYD